MCSWLDCSVFFTVNFECIKHNIQQISVVFIHSFDVLKIYCCSLADIAVRLSIEKEQKKYCISVSIILGCKIYKWINEPM